MLGTWLLLGIPIPVIFLYRLWKVYGPSPLNHYDPPTASASIPEHCVFCKQVQEQVSPIYQTEEIYVFPDLYPESEFHILIIPKRHIKNLSHLRCSDLYILEQMKETAAKLSADNSTSISYKIGFHRPLVNSVYHLHLHVISLPLTSPARGALLFGSVLFTDIDQSISSLHSKKKD